MNVRRALPTLAPGQVLACLVGLLLAVPTSAGAATFTVTSSADPGTGVCDVECTLREAITAANAAAGADVIDFSFAGTATVTISPATPLPYIGPGALTIDGTTHAGPDATTKGIELAGDQITGGAEGFRVNAAGTVIQGLAINGFTSAGISFHSAGNGVVRANYLGTDATGTIDKGNYSGLLAFTSGNLIGGTGPGDGNVISGNVVGVNFGGSNNTVQGNLIGTTSSGTGDLGNSGQGIATGGGAVGNLFGGTVAAARNVIAGNDGIGVDLQNTAAGGNRVQGNYIGVDVNGAALGNLSSGVKIEGQGNLIGGSIAGARNVISSNNFGASGTGGLGRGGVWMSTSSGPGPSQNTVSGNYIGLDPTGAIARGNSGNGIEIEGGAMNTIGGANAGTGNVIAANTGDGVMIRNVGASGNVVNRNLIGTAADGTTDRGNGVRGIFIFNSPSGTIGGEATGDGNTVAFNDNSPFSAGIQVQGTSPSNALRQNSTHANGGLGIELSGTAGVTQNDDLDPDTGPNNLQNFPVLTAVAVGATTTRVQGTLNSVPNASYELEFFASSVCDASGSGEGQTFLGQPTAGTATVSTGADGNGSFDVTLPRALPTGQLVVTGTATSATGDTSEFSACAQDVGPPSPPTLTGSDPASPAHDTTPLIQGTAEPDSVVRLYTASDCTGSPAGTGSGADFAGPGIQVTVPDDSTTTFRATATDGLAQASACSTSSLTYVDLPASTPDTFTVNSPADPGTGGCNTAECTLREAITAANATVERDIIDFSFAGTATVTISPTTPLPYITDDDLLIDGTTHAGPNATTKGIELAGNLITVGSEGLRVVASDVTIRGLAINRFTADAITLYSGTGNAVRGNYLGTDSTGTIDRGNFAGVTVFGTGNVIGGTGAGDGNVISGNGTGINFGGDNNTVQGNLIGTTSSGTGDLGNSGAGVATGEGAVGNLIGGTVAAARNVIAGNDGIGVDLQNTAAGGNQIQGNYVGVGLDGGALGNGAQGVKLEGRDNLIGGSTAGAGNLISANAGAGVLVSGATATANAVRQNSIHSNGGLGIHLLGAAAVSESSPVISAVVTGASTTRLQGSLSSAPSTTYELEFFANAACDSPTPRGEGRNFLGQPAAGTATVTTGAGGSGTFDVVLSRTLPEGQLVVTSTATAANGSTSEFSACAQDTAAPAPPALTATDPASGANENSPRVRGTAETDSVVRLYTSENCSGDPVATGSGASLASPGLQVTVPDDSATTYRATATDGLGQVSTCSGPITYTEKTTPEPTQTATPTPTATPTATPEPTAPILTAVSISPRVFRVAGVKLPAGSNKPRPAGTRLLFTLNQNALVNMVIELRTVGRRDGSKCVKATPALRNRRKCKRYVRRGSVSTGGKAGSNSSPWSGRVSGPLPAGSYRAFVTAIDRVSRLRSSTRIVTFKIVKR